MPSHENWDHDSAETVTIIPTPISSSLNGSHLREQLGKERSKDYIVVKVDQTGPNKQQQ
jgi:hypothetical protein